MPAPHDHLIMGLSVSIACLAGLAKYRWLLTNTRKGQALINRYGDATARKVVWLIFSLGILFGTLLATGFIRPINW